ncbi:MAG: LysR family transcriptional regulator [Hyphomonadaceae bacterium]|nr:LysR family transcriptional regulator [Hyphomonadaceae bacterium]
MDRSLQSFDWNHARAFLTTLDSGSLSAAARILGQSQPTIGRQIAELETVLRVALFEKAGRRLLPTPAAHDLADHVRTMAAAAERAALAASGHATEIDGPITITCSQAEAVYVMAPVIQRLRALHPGITVTLLVSNTPTDLARREADIGIRSFVADDPDLIIRKIRDDPIHLYATAAYLEQVGPVTSLADVAHAGLIGFSGQPGMAAGLRDLGIPVTQASFPIQTSCLITYIALVRQGLGLGLLTPGVAESQPGLVRVFDGPPLLQSPLWLACHRDLKTSRRIRLVYDFLADELARATL